MNRRTFFSTAAGSVLAPRAPRPNILIVTTDQQSAGAMSNRTAGRYLKTPAMDSLAASGSVFTRAYCANPLCIPSRTSMYTGRYPTETGIQTNEKVPLDARRFPTMGNVFREAGYETAYAGKWHLPFPPDESAAHGFSMLQGKKEKGDDGIAAAAARFLRARHEKPFLLVTSFVNPHNICQWARSEELPDGAIGADPPPSQCPPWRPNHEPQRDEPEIVTLMRRSYQRTPMFPVSAFDENKWRQYIWAYYRMIEKVDALIGQVLGALRESGLERNTVVVFTSDHGDCQGAHRWNQKSILWEEAVRVPFIVSYQGWRGVSGRLVHTGVDLIPTLCDYAAIPVPAGLPGLSVKASRSRQYVVVCDKLAQGAKGDPQPDGRMVRSSRYKYCCYSQGRGRESLVDLEKDPGEMINLAPDPRQAAVLNRHRAMLAEFCAKTRDSFPLVRPA